MSSSMAEYCTMVGRPFHASLEVSSWEQYLNNFRGGQTRVLVCTGTYHITENYSNIGMKELCVYTGGMCVDIAAIEVVMQWKISPHLMIATLWLHIGQAGWNLNIKAISVLFGNQKHIIPTEIPQGSECEDYDLALSQQTKECIRELIIRMYLSIDNGNLIATTIPYHCVDPLVLWYVNPISSHGRCVMAIILNYNAFSHQPWVQGCCHYMILYLGQETQVIRTIIDMRASIP